jgi:hypothetical protein
VTSYTLAKGHQLLKKLVASGFRIELYFHCALTKYTQTHVGTTIHLVISNIPEHVTYIQLQHKMMSQLHFAIASDAYGINPFKNTKRKLQPCNFSISEIKRHTAVLNEHVFPDLICSGKGWHHTAWQTPTTYHILSFHSSGVTEYNSLCLLTSFLKSFLAYIIKQINFFACN